MLRVNTLPKETVLVVGLGEIGYALFDLFRESGKFKVYGVDIDKEKAQKIAGKTKLPKNIDVMHICIPFNDQEAFVKTTVEYVKKLKPKLTIIDSTVSPGTTQKVFEHTKLPTVNSPIRGMHENLETMKKDIRFWTKYIGGTTRESADAARKHFKKLGLKTKVLKSSTETELAKLFETIYRAWMISIYQEWHRISRHFGADFNEVLDMIEDIHRIDLNKPLHYPDVIGRHCLIPNTELLLKSYESEFLRLILKSNEKRKEEIKNPTIKKEVEKIKKRAENLQKELAGKRY